VGTGGAWVSFHMGDRGVEGLFMPIAIELCYIPT
jgi:hypothetical protein